MIHLQVIDRYGRTSNVVSKKLVVSTGKGVDAAYCPFARWVFW